MIPITIKKYAQMMADNNLEIDEQSFRQELKDCLLRKKNGAKCSICGGTIWVAGSAAVGQDMCFTCITGENDSSEDYEVE